MTTHVRPEAFTDHARQTRIDLAAAYRLIHRLGCDDSIYTHISARLPGRHDRFLINPYGMRFEEVTASNLVAVDIDGNVVDDLLGLGINPAGFTIHSAIHAARPDVMCVLHTHTVAGVAISSLKQGLLPLNQWSMQFNLPIASPTTISRELRSISTSARGLRPISATRKRDVPGPSGPGIRAHRPEGGSGPRCTGATP